MVIGVPPMSSSVKMGTLIPSDTAGSSSRLRSQPTDQQECPPTHNPGNLGTQEQEQPSSTPTLPAPSEALKAALSSVPSTGEGYRILERIGQGSFAEVYRGIAPGGISVAIKKIIKPIDQEEARRELQSLELVKQLHHPFLLATHAYWLSEDRLFIVMELAEEGTLRDRLRGASHDDQKGLPPEELLDYLTAAAEALDFLHGKGVLHRDIKPENLLLSQGYVKVGDFGLRTAYRQGICPSRPAQERRATWRRRSGTVRSTSAATSTAWLSPMPSCAWATRPFQVKVSRP